MTKNEFIEAVQSRAHDQGHLLSKVATKEVVESVFDVLAVEMDQNKRISIPGFGTFTVKRRNARQGKNPRTGESITIPAANVAKFKPAPALKDRIQ